MVDIEKLEQELTQANSIEEVREILKNNGVEMSAEELMKLAQEQAPQGELSEDNLDAVAGGNWITPWEEILRRMREKLREMHRNRGRW